MRLLRRIGWSIFVVWAVVTLTFAVMPIFTFEGGSSSAMVTS